MTDGFSHYYTSRQPAGSRPALISHHLPRTPPRAGGPPSQTRAQADGGIALSFVVDDGVFSKNRVDPGTDLLIRSVPPLSGRALDLGCGYGAAGISLALLNPGADMWFCDVNERAVGLCRINHERLLPGSSAEAREAKILLSDGFSALAGVNFDAVISNPPIRAGKATVYRLFREARAHLAEGGALYIVIQKKQGMKSAFAELTGLFGACADIAGKAGYHVLKSVKV